MTYFDRSKASAASLLARGQVKILAIESSCDETAVAVVEDGRRLLADVVYSQIDLHTVYGGVVPEIASRAHVEKMAPLVKKALDDAGLGFEDIDAIAVTCGPGLVGALLVGVSYAKGLAFALDKPLLAVNHIEGHICANYLSSPLLEAPFLCLVVSGGHSHLISVEPDASYRLVGCTGDDAAGEAFDKAARVLSLAYPGGPRLDMLAETGDESRFVLPKPHTKGRFDYSFSGLKTAFVNLCHQFNQRGEALPEADLAASFRKAVVDHLAEKAVAAMKHSGFQRFALAGGVSANLLLRRRMRAECEALGLAFFAPELKYCGDNAAMIGAAAYSMLKRGELTDLGLNADPALRLI